MQRDLKPLLLSALVFPGAGQFALGRKALGALFALAALVAAGYFIYTALEPAMAIANEINRGAIGFDIPAITARLRAHHTGASSGVGVVIATWVIVAAWAASLIDVWLRPARSSAPGAPN